MEVNGTIYFKERNRQIVNFKDLYYDKKGFTDIDAVMEWRDKGYIFVETKYKTQKDFPLGQRIALERLVKDTGRGKHSLAIFCEHNVTNTDKEIKLADCKVRLIYYSKELKWRKPTQEKTVKNIVDEFINIIE